ncbi:MAG TPA: TlyA family RNA methyltransferase [Chloroflexota bacterium]|nr:TlyA family RNA methyltransferase [Chloroflexota bacterium]
MAQKKVRLDKLIWERGLVDSRSKAQGVILAGEVLVDGVRVDKPGTAVSPDAVIEVKAPLPYVSRGGLKLAGALAAFGLVVGGEPGAASGRVCADVGACTGGFTDVLLQNGAARVYAIDVGYGQLDWKLRQDARVVVMERTNARYLENLPEPVSFVCIDVSFISLKLILPAVQKWLTADADIVALVKPQFEAGPAQVGKGGIVRDTAVHQSVLLDLLTWTATNGLAACGLMRSPVTGSDGNVEFLLWLRLGIGGVVGEERVREVVDASGQ